MSASWSGPTQGVASGAVASVLGVRLGYLLAERGWGRGMASELVAGFVGWCRENGVVSISGGVAIDNPASARVLVKKRLPPGPD